MHWYMHRHLDMSTTRWKSSISNYQEILDQTPKKDILFESRKGMTKIKGVHRQTHHDQIDFIVLWNRIQPGVNVHMTSIRFSAEGQSIAKSYQL